MNKVEINLRSGQQYLYNAVARSFQLPILMPFRSAILLFTFSYAAICLIGMWCTLLSFTLNYYVKWKRNDSGEFENAFNITNGY